MVRYNLAEDLNKQLDDLSRNLSQMIEEVNRLSTPAMTVTHPSSSSSSAAAPGQLPDDPINQLSAILGAHLRALNSLDGNAGKLEGQVKELESKFGHAQGHGQGEKGGMRGSGSGYGISRFA